MQSLNHGTTKEVPHALFYTKLEEDLSGLPINTALKLIFMEDH